MPDMLNVKNLRVAINNNIVLNGLNISINAGETVAIMGPNGSGKSSLANTIMGNPKYKVVEGEIIYKGQNIVDWKTEVRAQAGIFLTFQYPVAIPGVTVAQLLKTASKSIGNEEPNPRELLNNLKMYSGELELDEKLLSRYVNDGFSGGEKKRLETLQYLILKPSILILDEIDSGLDIDGLQLVAKKINDYKNNERSIIIITHYQRILDYIKPDRVYVITNGRIVKEGDINLSKFVETHGYEKFEEYTNGSK